MKENAMEVFMKITYLGHASLLVQSKNYSVIIDPYLSKNPLIDIDPKTINVDAVIVSHGHHDHIGDSITIAKNNHCPIVASRQLCNHFLLSDHSVSTISAQIGVRTQLAWGEIELTPAIHGDKVDIINNLKDTAPPTGILLTMNGKTLYHLGDTYLFDEMKTIGDTHTIAIAALPIGGIYTTDIDESIIVAKKIKAKQYIPIHYDTFEDIQANPKEWQEKMQSNGFNTTLINYKETISI